MSARPLQSLLPSLNLPLCGHWPVAGVTLDSRRAGPQTVFVARRGSRHDGASFIADAVAHGATVILRAGSSVEEHLSDGVATVTVPDLDAALLELVEQLYQVSSRDLPILAITGTNGKTSIAHFAAQMLTASGMPCGVIGTLGARFGELALPSQHTTPDIVAFHQMLAALKQAGAQAVALEMSSHALDQMRLGRIQIQTAVFSNLSHDHLDYHGTLERYQAAKQVLFHHYGVQHAVINVDDAAGRAIFANLPPQVKAVSVAASQGDWGYREVRHLPQGVSATVCQGDRRVSLRAPLYGEFNVQNVVLAAAAVSTLMADFDVAHAFTALRAIQGRMEPVTVDATMALPQVLVDFAHTPDGIEKALNASRAHFAGALWCVLGCGGNRDAAKRPLMAAVAERCADHVLITSDNPRDEDPQAIAAQMLAGVKQAAAVRVELDRARAIAMAVQEAAANDVVLVAGKGHEQYQEIAGVQQPFSDVQVARQALHQRAGGVA